MIKRMHGVLFFDNKEIDETLKRLFALAENEEEVKRIYGHLETGLDVAANNQIFNLEK